MSAGGQTAQRRGLVALKMLPKNVLPCCRGWPGLRAARPPHRSSSTLAAAHLAASPASLPPESSRRLLTAAGAACSPQTPQPDHRVGPARERGRQDGSELRSRSGELPAAPSWHALHKPDSLEGQSIYRHSNACRPMQPHLSSHLCHAVPHGVAGHQHLVLQLHAGQRRRVVALPIQPVLDGPPLCKGGYSDGYSQTGWLG